MLSQPMITDITIPSHMALFFVVCCVITYSMTEIVKPLSRVLLKNKDLRSFAVRLSSCILGACAGYQISQKNLGAWLGFASGALNATIVSIIKKKLHNHVEKESKKEEKDELPSED